MPNRNDHAARTELVSAVLVTIDPVGEGELHDAATSRELTSSTPPTDGSRSSGPPQANSCNRTLKWDHRPGSHRVRDRSGVALGKDRAERSDPGPIERLVLRRGAAAHRGPPDCPMRGVQRSAREPSVAVLLPPVPVEVPWPLLLGFRPVVHDAARRVHLSHLREEETGARARRGPHRGDRVGRGRARVLEPSDRMPRMPPIKNSRFSAFPGTVKESERLVTEVQRGFIFPLVRGWTVFAR